MDLTTLLMSDEFVRACLYVVSAILAALAIWVAAQVRGDARLAKWANAIKLARDFAMNLMLTIRTEGMDMSAVTINGVLVDYNELAATSEERLGRKFDARFLFVADSVELFIKSKFGLVLEFDKFWPMYEGWYQRLRREDNGIVMNDNDVVQAQSAVLVSSETAEETERRREAQRARRERERLQRASTVTLIDAPVLPE